MSAKITKAGKVMHVYSIYIKQGTSLLLFRLYKLLTVSTFILFPAIETTLIISILKCFLGIFLQCATIQLLSRNNWFPSFPCLKNTFMDHNDARIHDKGFLYCCYISWKMQFAYVMLGIESLGLVCGENPVWISMGCSSKSSLIWFMITLQCLFTLCLSNIDFLPEVLFFV